MIREALSTFAEEIIIEADEQLFAESNDKDKATAKEYLEKKYPDVEFKYKEGFVNTVFIRHKNFVINLNKDPRKMKGKEVLFDINYMKEVSEKLKEGDKIKMLEPITFMHLYDWTDGEEEASDDVYIDKGEILTIESGNASTDYGSMVAPEMLDELKIKYKKVK